LEHLWLTGTGFGLHTAWGQFALCLPLTLVLLVTFRRIVMPAMITCTPSWARSRFVEPIRAPRLSWQRESACALFGSISHALLDAMAHRDGWFTLHLPLLRAPVLLGRLGSVPVCRIFHYAFSVLGSAFAALCLGQLLRRATRAPTGSPSSAWQSTQASPCVLTSYWVAPIVIATLVGARRFPDILAHPHLYFEFGPVYVWGFVLFSQLVYLAVALTLASAILPLAVRNSTGSKVPAP